MLNKSNFIRAYKNSIGASRYSANLHKKGSFVVFSNILAQSGGFCLIQRKKNAIIYPVLFSRGVGLEQKKAVFITEQEKQQQQEYALKCKEILSQRYLQQPLCHVHTYGCQANVADGERIKGMLVEMGYGLTDTPEQASLILYNTCAIRENAENHVFGNVGQLSHLKKEHPDLIIGLCGCMVQQEHITEKIKHSYPYVDMVFGTHVLHRLPEFVYRALQKQKRIFEIPESEGVIAEDLPVVRDSQFKASVQIMYGCNNFCTYCIVPYVKGRERSRKPADILQEVEELVQQGYKEIMLLGQNVNSYGKNLEDGICFSQLLRRINDIPGDFQIRFMTSHPKDATRELIDTIAECDKICKHLHLPVQCGNNRVLKAMNRSYTREHYLSLIDYAKRKIPNLSLTSDIIVGFPGETYEEFQDTLSLIREVRYDSLFTFIYSPRNGTKAAVMPDPIPAKEKSRWFQELLQAQAEIAVENLKRYEGQTMRVLVDGFGKQEGTLSGRNQHNMVVNFTGSPELIGEFVNVRITEARKLALVGDII